MSRFLARFRLIALVLALAFGASILLAQSGANDPLPILRLVVEPKHVATELEKVPQGLLSSFPLAEFDARVARIRQALQRRATKPRLTQARYTAELNDRSLTLGSGQWSIQLAGAEAAVLPMAPFNLALGRPKWEQGGDAIFAEFDGKTLGLLVKPGLNQTCLFDWSARGTPTNDGISFSLAVPPCPLTTFEFKLPADHWLFVPKDSAMVSGPHDAETPDKRLWKMQVAGSKPINFLMRKVAEPKGPAPTIFARVEGKQILAPGRVSADFEFQVDILHGSVRSLTLEGDAVLQPYDVSLKSGEVTSWQWKELPVKKEAKGKASSAPQGQLTIQFPQPVEGNLQGLKVRCLAARPSASAWVSPALRVRNALSRGETLVVQLHPDLAVGKWDAGSFQPTSIATNLDGAQSMILAETAANLADSRRPTLYAPLQGIDLHATENCQWRIEPRGATLVAEIQYAPARGSLLDLRLKLPKTFPGYQIESVDTEPADLLRGWHPVGDILIVELKKPLAPPKKALLKVQLRSGFRELATGIRVLNYPALDPLDATKREGALGIFVDPIFQAQLVNSAVPISALAEPPRENQAALGYRFAFRDQRMTAAIRLIPQPTQAQLRGSHAIRLAGKDGRLRFHWEVEPLVGAPEHLDFRFAPGFPTAWRVIEDEGLKIHHWERLPLNEALPQLLQLGCRNEMQAAALKTLLPSGTHWRFYLSEPLRKKSSFTIETTLAGGIVEEEWRRISLGMPTALPWAWIGAALAVDTLPKTAGDKVWHVPLMSPVQRTDVEQDIVIESSQEPIDRIDADGALEAQTPARNSAPAPLHVRLRPTTGGSLDPGSTITIHTRPERRSKSLLELCDEAALTSFVHRDGRTFHRVQFRMWNWHDRNFDLQFPPDMQIVAVRVHDRWIQRVQSELTSAHLRLTLPFDQNAEFVRYEVVARSQARGHYLPGLMKVEMPRIEWPSRPLEVSKRIFLEGDLTALHTETLAPVGVPGRIARRTATPRWLSRVWNWGQSWWPSEEQVQQQKKLDEQKKNVLTHEAQLRQAAGKPMKLSEALERLAFQHFKEGTPLVIDAVAFRSLGLAPETIVPASALSSQTGRPFWEALGLTYFPCPSGAVLTTSKRLERLAIDSPAQAGELDGAVREAILHGRDASDGFWLILNWLQLPAQESQAFAPAPASLASGPFDDGAGMFEWAFHPDALDADAFVVIEPASARVLAWIIAFLAALVLWKIERVFEARAGFRVCLLLLTCAVLIGIWLPAQAREFFAWPASFVACAGFVWQAARLVGGGQASARGGNSTVSHVAAGSAALVAFFLGIPWAAPAQTPAAGAYRVLVIEGEKPVALVRPDLLARLDELERASALGAQNVVLTGAKYTGKIAGAQAKLDVQYEIFSFADKTNLVIPLAGVQLQEGAFLDGAPVFPVAHPLGYALPIRGQGAHQLHLTFTARAALTSDESKLSFTMPRLAQNEIAMQWLAPVQAVHCLRCSGEEKLGAGKPQSTKEWNAQLGYENTLDLRWTNTAAPVAVKAIEVSEAHFWDLTPTALSLATSLKYRIGKGSLAQLTVAMPEGLHVRAVDAATAPGDAKPQPIIVKHWNVLGKGTFRRLLVDFVQPVSGNLALNLEIVPQAFGQNLQRTLPLPAPLQGKSAGGILGYRLDAIVNSTGQQNLSVTGILAEEFGQLWEKQKLPKIPGASRAFIFQRDGQQAVLKLAIETNALQTQAQLLWRLERHFAHLRGKFTVRSPHDGLALLEFHVDPALTLADVAGPDVWHWHLQDARLQVWLGQTRKETTIELTGWRAFAANSNLPPPKTFVLPKVYPLHTRLVDSTLEIQSAPDVQASVDQLVGLRQTGAENLVFSIDDAAYQATFRLAPRNNLPQAAVLTKVYASETGVEFWHGIRLTTERGGLPIVKLRVQDWPYDPLVLDAPGAGVQRTANNAGKDVVWALKYPPGLPREVFLILRGRVGKGPRAGVVLPVVRLDGATPRQHWLAWRGVEVQGSATGKTLAPQPLGKNRPDALDRDGSFWDLAGWNFAPKAPGALKVILPETPPRESARILASTEESWLTDEARWLHEASLSIHTPQATELRIRFPAAVSAFSALVDDRPHSAWNPEAAEITLPLDAHPAPRLVKLRWQNAADAESLDTPNIASLRFDQAAPAARQQLLWIPPGMTSVNAASSVAPTLVERLLQEAEVQLQRSAALAQDLPRRSDTVAAIASAQLGFAASLRRTEYALAALQSLPQEINPVAWRKHASELQNRNAKLAREHQYDAERLAAEKAKEIACLPGHGRAHPGIPQILPTAAAGVSLRLDAERLYSERRMLTELMLLVAIFFLVFSYFRHGWSILRAALPEASAALAIAGMMLWGIGLLGVVLVVLAALARGWSIATTWRRRRGVSPLAAAGPTESSGPKTTPPTN